MVKQRPWGRRAQVLSWPGWHRSPLRAGSLGVSCRSPGAEEDAWA